MAPEMKVQGRTASMELEPKTLTLDQLKYAREAALYVLSTKTTEEAIRIFTEGLKPVLVVQKCSMDSSDDDVEIDSDDSSAERSGKSSSGSHRARSIKTDVVTAPF